MIYDSHSKLAMYEAARKAREDTIEECARVADECEWQVYGYRGRISSAIRALKDKS